jgi:hypothetical protein
MTPLTAVSTCAIPCFRRERPVEWADVQKEGASFGSAKAALANEVMMTAATKDKRKANDFYDGIIDVMKTMPAGRSLMNKEGQRPTNLPRGQEEGAERGCLSGDRAAAAAAREEARKKVGRILSLTRSRPPLI